MVEHSALREWPRVRKYKGFLKKEPRLEVYNAKVAQLVEHPALREWPRVRKYKGFLKKGPRLEVYNAKVAQLVEHDLAKVGVAGPSPVFRSKIFKRNRN